MVTSALFRLNGEKYLSFQVGNLRFMDSFQFLSTSLDNLVVSLLLKSGRDKFSHATKHLWVTAIWFCKGNLSIFVYDRTRQIRRNPTPIDLGLL